ncbi:MAG: glycosyltransferase [Candidatus Lernaella stagnicola]|nr:glycosyltransferase [Candidatus Lernaella stagnicola]
MPRVSVIMPVFNAADYLMAALESIAAQTYDDWELVAVDDGSTDASPDILAKCDDARIRVVRQENAGVSAALNTGLQHAQGELIARLDADDIAAPHRLAVQVEFLDRHPKIDGVGSWVRYIDGAGRPLSGGIRRATTPLAVQRALVLGSPLSHPTVLLRRLFFDRHGAYLVGARHVEDYDLWVRAGREARLANLPWPLVDYRVHDTAVGVTASDEQRRNAAQVARRALDILPRRDSLFRRWLAGRQGGRWLRDESRAWPRETTREATDLDFITLGTAGAKALVSRRWRLAVEIACETAGFATVRPGAVWRFAVRHLWRLRRYYREAAGARLPRETT